MSGFKTTDDYLLRLFAIAFTKRRPNQIKKTTYAASSQIRAIRKKMTEIIQREATSCTLTQLTAKLIPEVIGREMFVHFPNGAGRSKFTTDYFERRLGVGGTARNLNTVRKLIDLAAAD